MEVTFKIERGVFQHLVNQTAIVDKAVFSLWGRRRVRPFPQVELGPSRKILERNRELYRYEETEIGDFEGVLGEYLKGDISFTQVLKEAQSRARPYTQTVSSHQVGSVENEVPGVVDSPVAPADDEGADVAAAPPIIRDSVTSSMKILTTSEKYPQLNGFTMLLGLSDRLFRTESEFFHNPHTTRILWAVTARFTYSLK